MSPAKSARRVGAELTREHIVAVASELFAARGFALTSLQDVADAARLSRPGLLKHFASKSAVLEAIAEDFVAQTVRAADSARTLREAAERWSTHVPRYRQLSTILLHESLTLPAQQRRMLVAHHEYLLRGQLDAREDDFTADRVDDSHAVIVMTAIWEGLQVIGSYVDDASPVAREERPLLATAEEARDALSAPSALGLESVLSDGAGYASGRRRRDAIVADATALFSLQGYHGTTMREIAERVNVTPSALLYYFADKAELLAEVLRQRDVQMVDRRAGQALDPVAELRSIGAEALRDQLSEEGLIALYAVLSTESASPTHPAHEYFRERVGRTVSYFENVFARAAVELGIHLEPRREALLLVALWDGLQYQYLLSADGAGPDIPHLLDRYIAGALASARRHRG